MNGNSLGTDRVLSVVSYIASGCQRTLLRPGSTLQKWKGAGTRMLRPRDPGTLAGKRSSGGEGGTVHPPSPNPTIMDGTPFIPAPRPAQGGCALRGCNFSEGHAVSLPQGMHTAPRCAGQ